MGPVRDNRPLLYPRHPNNNSFLWGYPGCSILPRSCSYLLGVILTLLCVAEILLSGLYIWEIFVSLKPVLAVKNKEGRRMMLHLFLVYILFIALPGILLMLEYAHFFFVEMAYSPFVYSLKLRMEFGILTKLISLVTVSQDRLRQSNPLHDSNTLPLDTYQSIANHTPDSGTSTPSLDSLYETHGTKQGQSYYRTALSESDVHVSAPARALSLDYPMKMGCRA